MIKKLYYSIPFKTLGQDPPLLVTIPTYKYEWKKSQILGEKYP